MPSHSPRLPLLLLFFVFFLYLPMPTTSWQKWDYTGRPHKNEKLFANWRDTWGYPSGPRGRRGHTMVLYNSTKLLLFGGRDNEHMKKHVPKTYEIEVVEGEFHFKTYDQQPVNPTYDVQCAPIETCTPLEGGKKE